MIVTTTIVVSSYNHKSQTPVGAVCEGVGGESARESPAFRAARRRAGDTLEGGCNAAAKGDDDGERGGIAYLPCATN